MITALFAGGAGCATIDSAPDLEELDAELDATAANVYYGTQAATLNITGPAWVEVPGTAVTFQTAAASQLLEATSTGALRVLPSSWCGLRFVVDGAPAPEADLASGDLAILPGTTVDGYQTAAVARRFRIAAAGTHTLAMQAAANGGSCVAFAAGATGLRVRAEVVTPSQSLYATQSADLTVSAPTWTNVPGASIAFSTTAADRVVSAVATGAVRIAPGGWCGLRYTVDGAPAAPADPLSGDLALLPASGVDGYQTAAVSRAWKVPTAGAHTLRLQAVAQGGTCTLFAAGGTGMRMIAKIAAPSSALLAAQTANQQVNTTTWTDLAGTQIPFSTTATNSVIDALATGAVRMLPHAWCGVRFVVDGVPAPVSDVASGDLVLLPNVAQDGYQTAALLRRFQVTTPGTHVLKLQASAQTGSCVFSASGGTGLRTSALLGVR